MIHQLISSVGGESISKTETFLLSEPPLFIQGSAQLDEAIQQDIRECQKLLGNIQQGEEQLLRKVQRLKSEFGQANFNSGISYFDTKNMLMTQYLIELHFYILFRINGVDLTQGKGFELYKNLLYLKTLMMKLSPLEKKLEYKTQKILREGVMKHVSVDTQKQATSLRANPKNLMKQRSTENTQSKIKKYVAPKITPALMPQDKQRAKEARKVQRRQDHLQRDLGDNWKDEDQQVQTNMLSEYDRRAIKKLRQKQQYEEDNFVRLPQTRKDKQERARLQKMKVDDVSDLSELRKMRQLMKYKGLIEQDFEKEQKLDRILQRTKKIQKAKSKY